MFETDLDYRVDLEVFNGPLDLLLHLVKKDEIEITEISLARVADQFLDYMKLVPHLSVDAVGEFVVTAATLMLLKSRALLPVEERPPLDEEDDPGAELIRNLLEYRRVKEAARLLEERAFARDGLFPRAPAEISPNGEERLLRVEIWDLVRAFSKLLKEVSPDGSLAFVDEDVPVGLLIGEILRRIRAGPVRFRDLFEGRTDRGWIISYFLALLELIKDGRVVAVQETAFGEIILHHHQRPLPLLLPPAGGTSRAADAAPPFAELPPEPPPGPDALPPR